MDFEPTDDQIAFRDSVDRVMARSYTFEDRAKYLDSAAGWSTDAWKTYAEIGLLGLPFSLDDGGFGGEPVDLFLAMTSLGRGLVLEPFLSTVVLCGTALSHWGSEAQRARFIPSIVDGTALLAFAHAEPESRYDLSAVQLSATPAGGGWQLSGRKVLVLHGDSAQHLLVSARIADGDGRGDIGIFIVDAAASGVQRRSYKLIDGTRAADCLLIGVQVEARDLLATPAEGLRIVEQVYDAGIVATAGEAVGAMEALHAATVAYLKTRRQFGVPIGSFQALQHRAVDMLIALEQARSLAMFAAMSGATIEERKKSASAAKVLIRRSGRYIAQQAIQLHGGIGMTWELSLGHYARKLLAIDALFGDADHHLARLTALGGFVAAAQSDRP